MPKRTLVTVIAATVTGPVLALGLAAPATAMHDSPAPVDDMAAPWSGHYTTPDTGQKGAARPWEAGPSWSR